jgi:hypothetical protein
MLRNSLAACLLFISQSFAAELSTQAEWTHWEISLTRTDTSGKILSQAKAPLAVYQFGGFNTHLVINMGTGAATRLWTVECMFDGDGDKLLEFEVSDTTRIISWTSDGSSISRAAVLFDIETSWHGAGRYQVFSMDGETLTADIHPVPSTKADNDDGADSTVIVVTRRDRNSKILSQTTAPWPAASDNHDCRQSLAIQSGTKDAPQTLLVRCEADSGTLRFRAEALAPIKGELGGTQVRRLILHDTRSPINASGKYMILELDGEILEAEIRSAGKLKPDDQ